MLEVLVGFGIAGTGFGVILAVVGRASSDENRAMALAIATAAGSAGQVFGAPVAEALLAVFTWQIVFVVFAATILASLAVLPMMRAPAPATKDELTESLSAIILRAGRDPSYLLLFVGFFSCGYQLAFITAHFPAMVTEMSAEIDPTGFLYACGIFDTSALGAVAISLIGLANIGGTLAAGWAGNRFPRKYLLAGIYTGRNHRRRFVHNLPDHARQRYPFCHGDGVAVACDRAAYRGPCRASIWAAPYGHALRAGLLLAPIGQLLRRLARRMALRPLWQLQRCLVARRGGRRILGHRASADPRNATARARATGRVAARQPIPHGDPWQGTRSTASRR